MMDNKTSQKQLDSARKYHAGFDDIKLRVVMGEREAFRKYAVTHGWKSLNACMIHLMNYAISHDLRADDLRANQKDK